MLLLMKFFKKTLLQCASSLQRHKVFNLGRLLTALLQAVSVIALSTLGFFGCSKNDFPRYASLDRLRILAIVADIPELQNPSAGMTNIQITPYISDIGGFGDIQMELQSCLDAGVSLGVEPDCAGAPFASSLQVVTLSSTATATAGLFGDPERTGSPQSGAITLPLQIPANLLDQFTPTLKHNGISYLITMKATSTSASVKSFRRILISTKTPNTNPTLADLLVDGLSLAQTPTIGIHTLGFSTADTPETYQFLKGNGELRSLQESYELTWFVSDGLIETNRARLNETAAWDLSAINPALPRKPVVVGVLRDGRGGVAVQVKTLTP